jgi:aspartate aminotransferase
MHLDIPAMASDPLWALTEAFKADPRSTKIDLGLGVYRDESGITPVFAAVQAVEKRLAAAAISKTYRALSGHAAFNAGMSRLLLGDDADILAKIVTIQTVGGSGAVRLLGELVAASHSSSTAWLSDPGYVNHPPIMKAAGLKVAYYPWRERDGNADIVPMLAVLEQARPRDILVVQGRHSGGSGRLP